MKKQTITRHNDIRGTPKRVKTMGKHQNIILIVYVVTRKLTYDYKFILTNRSEFYLPILVHHTQRLTASTLNSQAFRLLPRNLPKDFVLRKFSP